MPFAAIGAYMDRLPERQSELRLMLAEIAMLPHMAQRDREAALRRWRATVVKPGKASPEILRLHGIAVVRHTRSN